MVNHMLRNTFPMCDYCIIHLSLEPPGARCTTSALICTSCTRAVQENVAIGLVVLQSTEILGLIICFAIHFLCVTIEYIPKPRRPGERCTTSSLV